MTDHYKDLERLVEDDTAKYPHADHDGYIGMERHHAQAILAAWKLDRELLLNAGSNLVAILDLTGNGKQPLKLSAKQVAQITLRAEQIQATLTKGTQ